MRRVLKPFRPSAKSSGGLAPPQPPRRFIGVRFHNVAIFSIPTVRSAQNPSGPRHAQDCQSAETTRRHGSIRRGQSRARHASHQPTRTQNGRDTASNSTSCDRGPTAVTTQVYSLATNIQPNHPRHRPRRSATRRAGGRSWSTPAPAPARAPLRTKSPLPRRLSGHPVRPPT